MMLPDQPFFLPKALAHCANLPVLTVSPIALVSILVAQLFAVELPRVESAAMGKKKYVNK